ncbi:MAG TPA: aldo/keto reductase, partial [Rhodospirillales bacterium]|nr:aldo/keto reductase [Rhodospirillales bacterium]
RIGDAHGATPRQVALAFLTRRPSLFAIPKAASAAHVVENAGSEALQLGSDEIAALDRAFPLGSEPNGLPML